MRTAALGTPCARLHYAFTNARARVFSAGEPSRIERIRERGVGVADGDDVDAAAHSTPSCRTRRTLLTLRTLIL
jgi:hypothetical protein